MGEYAIHAGKRIKIGTCKDMYYLRADQAHDVTAEDGNVDPVTDAEAIRFRFPWPDEDNVSPGNFNQYNRGYRLNGMQVPDELADEHYSVQFKAGNGYLCSLPCPESGKVPQVLHANLTPQPVKIHRNGYGGAVELVSQRHADGILAAICRCKGCGMMWRLTTLEDAQPALDALEAMAAREDRTAEQNDTPGNAEIAESIREIARRLRAGYGGGNDA